jgi:hypothetical protein
VIPRQAAKRAEQALAGDPSRLIVNYLDATPLLLARVRGKAGSISEALAKKAFQMRGSVF